MEATQWTPVRNPFLLPPSQLPAPLPTEKEFLESRVVLRDDASYHRVVVVGPHFIVKHGRGVLEREGQTLLFLQKHLNNIVTGPKLYAMFRMASTGHLCLIMQRLSGESLETMWPTLDEDGKTTICRKLKEFFATIRRIPSPGFYGSVERGSMPHHLFYSAEGDRSICGPFTSELELNAAFVKKLREIWATNGKHSFKADFYEANLDTMLNSHKPVFSHSDLQAKNILVRNTQAQGSSVNNDFEISVVDWEEAGWYPDYWEYATIFVGFLWTDDWPKRLEQIIDPWPGQAAVLRMLFQELCF